MPGRHRRPSRLNLHEIIWTALTIAIVATVVTLIIGMATAPAGARQAASTPLDPVQVAIAQRDNCQLLADNSTGGRRTRALDCVSDQNRIIALRRAQTPTPVPSTTPPASPPATTAPPPTTSTTPPPTTPVPTTTPPPTTLPPGPMVNCWDNPGTCGYPDAASTGNPDSNLTVLAGNVIISGNNTVLDHRHFTGCVTNRAAGTIIRNSLLDGNCVANIMAETGSITIVDSTIICTQVAGVWGSNFHVMQGDISGCDNALEINAGSSVEDSWLRADEGRAGAHGDVIQSQGGTGVLIRHNTMLVPEPMTSNIISNPDLNNNWTVTDNFFGGGAFTVYCPENGTGWTVLRNRFVPAKTSNIYSAAFGLTDACNHAGITWGTQDGTGNNYRDDNLNTVNAAGQG